jgi:hypothetical protein
MQITFCAPDNLPPARLWQRVKEFEDSLKAEATILTLHQTSLPREKSSAVDVLQTMAQLAQPMGIADLSHHFDEYTRRVLPDEITP